MLQSAKFLKAKSPWVGQIFATGGEEGGGEGSYWVILGEREERGRGGGGERRRGGGEERGRKAKQNFGAPPRKCWGRGRVKGGAVKGGGPEISPFSPSPATILFLSSSRGILVVFVWSSRAVV